MSLFNVHFDAEDRFDMVVSREVADELIPYAMLPEDVEADLGHFTLRKILDNNELVMTDTIRQSRPPMLRRLISILRITPAM